MPDSVIQHQLHRHKPEYSFVMNQTFTFAFDTDVNNLLVSFTFTTHKPAQTNRKINHFGVENCWKTWWKITNAFQSHSAPLLAPFSPFPLVLFCLANWCLSAQRTTADFSLFISSTSCCCPSFTCPFLPSPNLCKLPLNLQLSWCFCQCFKCLCPMQVQGEARGLHPELQPLQCTSYMVLLQPLLSLQTDQGSSHPWIAKSDCFGPLQ